MKRSSVFRALGGTILTAGLVITAAPFASAAPVHTETTPTAAEAGDQLSALKRDLGLSTAEVEELQAAEAEAMDVEEGLRETLGSDFGGAHFDIDSGELTVSVTDAAAVSTVEAAGANAEVVDFGEPALDAIVEDLNTVAEEADDSVTGWYVDTADDSVVITVLEGDTEAAEALVAEADVDGKAVRVEETTEQPKLLANVIGGNAYYFGGYRCSVGFSVRHSSGPGFATAGHCGDVGTRTTSPTGTIAGSYFPGRDMGWVRITSADTVTPLVNRYNGSYITVTGSSEAANGSSVCRSGSTTGWHCGTIQSKNQTVNYAEGSVAGLTRTTACAEGGDSGGSWLTGTQAQGVTSGGSGNCTWGGTTYFQPINPLLSYFNLTLVTG
ncbi:S1 family peptidase [Actinorugispora endophytica]|uniref:Streptogrisin C n=1 Tax=Actinorugispora endophytica TaxID=1605990 RepID=A0A4V3D956_9ACTN|nr:S1 family peptidase [Actinorugispora endophytica]TDQ54770.1 streptogrisin C [Actinorugispora endophytica]